MKSDQITALAVLIPAVVDAFIALWRELRKVHSLVNNQLEKIMDMLDRALMDNIDKDAQIARQKKTHKS